MMKVFVTGATGVIGRRTVPALVAAGHDVQAVARTAEKAAVLAAAGATPATVDLFDPAEVATAVSGCDAVLHLATNIPTGASAALKSAWRTNDRLRSEVASNLAGAVRAGGVGRYIGESITFPYIDNDASWISEDHPRTYFDGNQTCVDAEAAAASVTHGGGVGITLRFAMFFAADSAHVELFRSVSKRGLSPLFGSSEKHISFIHVVDAASAVVAALDAPAGVYNVAEPNPLTRAEHNAALATVVGRKRLRQPPRLATKAGGAGVESLSRSQRISSTALTEATGWRATIHAIDTWKSLS
jgi:nucleoside-diphosphate-sugar epimerase